MVGEFTGVEDSSPNDDVKLDAKIETGTTDGFKTDVEGIMADGSIKHGKDEFPCFNVSKNSFFQNMTNGRKRIRFEKDSNVQKYMQGTKYNRKFYVKYKDENGKEFVRPVK